MTVRALDGSDGRSGLPGFVPLGRRGRRHAHLGPAGGGDQADSVLTGVPAQLRR
ncbi:hypothetical protein SAMN05661080_01875 [Modestobacter sp. DSM 44400]|nr:hypothetical protein SAMN05661080_01875 [Modestobacter sp. DSM 44400]